MFETEVNAVIALSAGVLSFFSPCMLPLIPAYILYIADLEHLDEVRVHRKRVMFRTMAFIVGFTSVFLLFGFSASAIGRVFAMNRLLLMKMSGVVLVVLGLYLMGVIPIKQFGKTMRLSLTFKSGSGIGAFLMGVVFAAGWTPCFGPVLASILMLATGEKTVLSGVGLLALYSLGMAVPFFVTAWFIVPVSKWLARIEGFTPILMKMGGVVLVITGVLMFFNQLSRVLSI